jgi:hypothetical protein
MGKRRLGVLSGDSPRPGAVGGTNKDVSAWTLSGEDVRRRAVDLADWQLVGPALVFEGIDWQLERLFLRVGPGEELAFAGWCARVTFCQGRRANLG